MKALLFPKDYFRAAAIALGLALVFGIFFVSKVTIWGYWPAVLPGGFLVALCGYYASLVLSEDNRKNKFIPSKGGKWFAIVPVALAFIVAAIELGSK